MTRLDKLTTPEAKQEAVEDLMNMQGTRGWALIIEFLQDNIKELEKFILDPTLKDGDTPYTEQEINLFRDKLRIQKGFANLPENLIKVISESPVEGQIDFDPYFK